MQATRTRSPFIHQLGRKTLDVLVIGGGIQGAASAAALSHAGYAVGLVEAGDFASETSQASSNLIWGGIKYFESLDFALVRELCLSRNELLRHYPHQVKEIRFYAVCEKTSPRPAWQLQLGAWLYWLWGNARTSPPRRLHRKDIRKEEALLRSERWNGGVEYSDAYLPEGDARFTFGMIEKAWKHGAAAVNYTRARSCLRINDLWETEVADEITGTSWTVRSKAVVNAAGPWAETFSKRNGIPTRHRLAYSKGVHLIVPRLSDHKRVLSFFSDDGRPFFVLPFGDKTCLGTTDTKLDRPSKDVSPEDRAFILENINKRLSLPRPLVESDIIAERSGVRPLVVSPSERANSDWISLSRKHSVEVKEPGFISIFGGKMTDCLNIGREILDLVGQLLPRTPFTPSGTWYGETPCPKSFLEKAASLGLSGPTTDGQDGSALRLWRRYGSGAFNVLHRMAENPNDAEEVIRGSGFYFAEVSHIAQFEMAETMEDFLRRRTLLLQTFGTHRLLSEPGIRRACDMIFGERAEEAWSIFTASSAHVAPTSFLQPSISL